MPGLPLRRRATVAAVCLSAVMAATIAVDVAHTSVSSKALSPTAVPGSAVPARPAAAILPLLDDRATALRSGDVAGWLAPLDAGQDATTRHFRSAQRQVFDRVRSLEPVSWSYQVMGGAPLAADRVKAIGGPAWLADVQLDYQLAARGQRVRREQYLTIVSRPGGWRIAADTDGPTGRDLWDLSPVTHASAGRCEVVGAQSQRKLVGLLAAECGAAARRVDAAWGTTWTRQTVLTIPGSLRHLAILLGRTQPGANAGTDSDGGTGTGTSGTGGSGPDPTAGLERTAAVTIGPAGAAADEVLINGAAFDDLRPIGRRVVLTHELVHVATRATGSRSAPTWLEEGFADYVAYRDTGLPADQVAGEALAAVHAGHLPGKLPATGDFNAAADKAAAAYGEAWVAVQVIAAKAGSSARMKAFYQRAARSAAPDPHAGPDAVVDAALRWVGLHGIAGLTEIWRARLRELAR